MSTASPNPNANQQVEALQRDGLLLIAYLARRADRHLVQNGQGHDETVELALLTAPSAEVAGDPDRFGRLLKTIDSLGRSALPATTTTIRTSADYLFGTPDLTAADARRALKAPTRTLGFILGILFVATALSVYLLMHVDDGRRTIGQLVAVNGELATTFNEMARLDPAKDWVVPKLPEAEAPQVAKMKQAQPASMPLPGVREAAARPAQYVEFCEPDPPPSAGSHPKGQPEAATPQAAPYRVPATPQAQHLCSLLSQLRLREAMVYANLTEWNCAMVRLRPTNWPRLVAGAPAAPASPATAPAEPHCLEPPFPPQAPANAGHWQRTELRTSASIAMLTGYVLPVLLGCIGGCVYVLRRTDDKIGSWTLSAKDGKAGLVRIVLAAACGGLLGVVFGTDAPVQLGGFSLSLAAWAFFLGYSLETVLRLLDTVVRSVVDRLQPPEANKQVTMTAK